MSNLNTNFDGNDFDNFLNLDNDFAPSTISSATHTVPSNVTVPSQPTFSGPSHQYDSFRQQTGLPMGSLASTFAVNQASGLHYRPGNMGFVMPTETLNIPLSNLDDFDFGKSQFDTNDMDFDADSPSDVQNMYYPSGPSHIKTESSQSTPIQRIYPGMHSQQAAQKQKQQELLRQQQQQPKQIPGQLPLPSQAPKTAKDPHVEESISRLLSRMRQSSTSSIDESTPVPSNGSAARLKKDEEDMDEDERLLASEEGKKLSSKERRQLRNKVSARAFRSRRKEYIGQLEGEVAVKVQEANDLRVQNRQLMEENTRLTDLTRMLLSSQAFSGFLQELSNSGMSLPSSATTVQSQQPQQSTRKDIPAHEASRQLQSQNQHHVGMTFVPENNIDISDFSNNWNVPLPSNDFQVFSITAIPEPPVLDLSVLSEKSCVPSPVSPVSSKEAPQLSSLPPSIEVSTEQSVASIDSSDDSIDEDASDLYATTTTASTTTTSAATSVQSLLQSLTKPDSTSDAGMSSHTKDTSDLSSQLQRICSIMEESCERMEQYLP